MTGSWIGTKIVVGWLAGFAALAPSPPSNAAPGMRPGWYVAPGGSPRGQGTSRRPWSLTHALAGARGRIQPGDTIWLRGGTYRGFFRTGLKGGVRKPIVFREFPGERATIDGGLRVDGPDVVFWGFEILQSRPLATNTMPALETWGARTRFVNLIIHDAGQQGITFWDRADDAEIYGCIVYNNGTHENKDHGVYVHNASGRKVLADNVFFNNLAYGIHVYAGPKAPTQRNVHLVGNVVFNNGTISRVVPAKGNVIIGAEVRGEGHRVIDNMLYFSGVSGRNLTVGYIAANQDVEVRGNTVWGGATALRVGAWEFATIADNRFGGLKDVVDVAASSLSGHTWIGNQYYRNPAAPAWRYAGTPRPLRDWQRLTGLGLSDVASRIPPADPTVFVRPNQYEPGRALVVVFNWTRQGYVVADLAGVLTAGDQYEVRNVQDLFGPPIASGFYGSSIVLPMRGVAAPPRLGRTTPAPPRTGPHFDAFVVTRVAN